MNEHNSSLPIVEPNEKAAMDELKVYMLKALGIGWIAAKLRPFFGRAGG